MLETGIGAGAHDLSFPQHFTLEVSKSRSDLLDERAEIYERRDINRRHLDQSAACDDAVQVRRTWTERWTRRSRVSERPRRWPWARSSIYSQAQCKESGTVRRATAPHLRLWRDQRRRSHAYDAREDRPVRGCEVW